MDNMPIGQTINCEDSRIYFCSNDDGINWRAADDKGFIPYCDVINATFDKIENESKITFSITLHYIVCNEQTKVLTIERKASDGLEDCSGVVDEINQSCRRRRPKNILVIINPIAGNGDGKSIFEKRIKPILNLAGISYEIVVSEYHKHLEEHVKTLDLKVDGLVILGGDGTLQEFMLPALQKIQNENGIKLDDPDVSLKPLDVPIAIVPIGTGNGLAGGCYKTKDIETPIYHLLRGHTKYTNILSLWQENRLIGFCSVMLGYGYFLDLTTRTDKMRWLGNYRHAVGLLKSIFSKQRNYHAEIAYRPTKEEINCTSYRTETDIGANDGNIEGWKKIFTDVIGFSAFPGIFRVVDGKLDYDVFSNGFTIQLESATDLWTYFKYLMKMKDFQIEFMEFDFCTFIKVNAVSLKLTNTTDVSSADKALEQVLHFDGENRRVDSKSFEIRLHKDLVKIFCD